MQLRGQIKDLKRQLMRLDQPTLESLWFVREASQKGLVPEEVVMSRGALLVLIGQIYLEKNAADRADDEAHRPFYIVCW